MLLCHVTKQLTDAGLGTELEILRLHTRKAGGEGRARPPAGLRLPEDAEQCVCCAAPVSSSTAKMGCGSSVVYKCCGNPATWK